MIKIFNFQDISPTFCSLAYNYWSLEFGEVHFLQSFTKSIYNYFVNFKYRLDSRMTKGK